MNSQADTINKSNPYSYKHKNRHRSKPGTIIRNLEVQNKNKETWITMTQKRTFINDKMSQRNKDTREPN